MKGEKQKVRGKSYIVLLLAVGLMACQPDKSCRQDIYVACQVTLQGIAVDSIGEEHEFTTWDSITVQGVGNDSILYDNNYSVSKILLPLRLDTNLTAYSITWQEETDTLYIQHTNSMTFISMACGCAIYHTVDSVWYSGSRWDSIKIVNTAVEAVAQENVRLYKRVDI